MRARRDSDDEEHQRPENPRQLGVLHAAADVLLIRFGERADLQLLLHVSLQHADPREALLGEGRNGAVLVLNGAIAGLHTAADKHHRDACKRHQHEGDKRELPTEEEHGDDDADQHHRCLDQADHAHSDKLADRIQVVGQTCHQVAGVHLLIERLVELLQMEEEVLAKVVLHIARDPVDAAALKERADRLAGGCGDE